MDLEPEASELHAAGAAALAFAERFVAERRTAPAADLEGAADLAGRIAAEHPPEVGIPVEDALARVGQATAKGEGNGGPGFLAYVPGGGG